MVLLHCICRKPEVTHIREIINLTTVITLIIQITLITLITLIPLITLVTLTTLITLIILITLITLITNNHNNPNNPNRPQASLWFSATGALGHNSQRPYLCVPGRCKVWYHPECIGLSAKQFAKAQAEPTFTCKVCEEAGVWIYSWQCYCSFRMLHSHQNLFYTAITPLFLFH